MNKIVKFALLSLLGIIVVVAGLVAYIAATFDPNQYKPQIVQAVKDQTQRTIRIEGDIRLSLFPGIGATLGKVWLSERTSDQEFAGIEDFRIALKLLPLLSKQVVIDTVEIRNLRLNLVRGKDGKINIDDLTGGGKSTPAANAGAAPVRIDIDHFMLRNATITYTDQAQGEKYTLSKLDLETGRLASGVPGKIALSFAINRDQPKLDLETTLKTTFTFDLEQQQYALGDLDLSAKGSAAGISDLVIKANGSVDTKLTGRDISISKLSVVASGRQQDDDLNLRLDIPLLSVTTDQVSGEKLAFDATVSQRNSKMVIRLDVPTIEGNAPLFAAKQLNASIDLQQEGATTQLRLTSPLTGSVEAQRIELPRLIATININNPRLIKNPLAATINGAAQADLARQYANWTFSAKIDDSNINGKAGLAKFTPPLYTFDINIDQLDADRYLPADTKPKQPEQLFDLSAFKGLNVNGSLKIGMLRMNNIKASDVRLDIKP